MTLFDVLGYLAALGIGIAGAVALQRGLRRGSNLFNAAVTAFVLGALAAAIAIIVATR
jgi:hypothetical protein